MEIKKLQAKELYRLVELFDYADADAMVSECAERMRQGAEDIFVLLEKGILAGELHAMYQSDDERFAIRGKRAYLFAFRIRESFQNQGYGKKLIKTVLTILREKGYNEFTVGVESGNLRAKHIYQEMGFTEFVCRKTETYQGDSYEFDLYMKK